MPLANLSICCIWKNIKSEYNNNKFRISAPTWNDTIDLPDGSYNIEQIQNYFEYVIKKHETITDTGSSKKVNDKNKDGEIVPRLEVVEVVLVQCNLVNSNYQQASKVLFTFAPNKQFGQLITITPQSLTMLKTTNAEFSFTEILFIDQNNRPLEIEDNVNITLIIGIS